MASANDDDDPFGMFDDDNNNDEDEDKEELQKSDVSARDLARALIEMANQKKVDGNSTRNVRSVPSELAPHPRDIEQEVLGVKVDPSSFPELVLPWRKPFFMHPKLKLVSSLPGVGGGRGWIATDTIAPGTLILVERPILLWPSEKDQENRHPDMITEEEEEEEEGDDGNQVETSYDNNDNELDFTPILERIIQHHDANTIVHELEYFHPTKNEVDRLILDGGEGGIKMTLSSSRPTTSETDTDISNFVQIVDMMQLLDEKYKKNNNHRRRLHDLIEMSKEAGVKNADQTNLTRTDCLRLILALRYNGLESGIYTHTAMINHADPPPPNCVKFLPNQSETVQTNQQTGPDQNDVTIFSEVRATRRIRSGECLTISYLPKLWSHASRRKYLWAQHRFDIGDGSNLPPFLHSMELVDGRLPVSSTTGLEENVQEETSTTKQLETAIDELRSVYSECDLEQRSLQQTEGMTEESLKDVLDAHAGQIQELEQAAWECCRQAKDQLRNSNHILLIPCFELHVDCAHLVLVFDAQSPISANFGKRLTFTQRMMLLSRMVTSLIKLLDLQETFYGEDHFELARANLDLAQAIEELLSKSPKSLFELKIGKGGATMISMSAWAAREHQARQEYMRIKGLYSKNDASTYATLSGAANA